MTSQQYTLEEKHIGILIPYLFQILCITLIFGGSRYHFFLLLVELWKADIESILAQTTALRVFAYLRHAQAKSACIPLNGNRTQPILLRSRSQSGNVLIGMLSKAGQEIDQLGSIHL